VTITAKDFAKAQVEAGCDIIGMGDAICSQISDSQYQEFVLDKHEEIVEYIAKNIKSNVRELEGVIISMIAQASFNRREFSLELAKQIVDKFVKNTKKEVSIDYIQKVVSKYFDMDVVTLQSKTRKRHIVQARQLAMYFAKRMTKTSLASIGSQIGQRDHATVLHACKTVDNLTETDKQFRKYVEDLRKKLTF
jgi:chromosomal replication initiator protein